MKSINDDDYLHRTYAGVLGKIIGVYLGRPVEGWPYADIVERFGQLDHYVNHALGLDVVTADDDISGSFGFARAVVDHDAPGAGPTARQFGDTWLNYVVEDRTILWWGGRGRSTEHTAFLNLSDGVAAPDSGSFARNGATLPVQVGAQIFVDALAMMCPGDPPGAASLARRAASVSHDGAAVEAAGFIAALEAGAYEERDLDKLVDGALAELTDPVLLRIADDVRAWSADAVTGSSPAGSWREVRAAIEDRYGYERFAGPCPVTTNFAAVLAALLLGADSFHRSVTIAASAGWDTDSNAGVVGAVNGIRLGLDGIAAEADLRSWVADQLLVVTSDGGECLTDAVRETRAIARGRDVLAGRHRSAEPRQQWQRRRQPRFGFEFPGSVQGFGVDAVATSPYARVHVANVVAEPDPRRTEQPALRVACHGVSRGNDAAVSTPTFLPRPGPGDNFSTVASPTLYPGNTVRVRLRLGRRPAASDDAGAGADADAPGADAPSADPMVRPFVVVENSEGVPAAIYGDPAPLAPEPSMLSWTVPPVGPNPVLRFGLSIGSDRRFDGDVIVDEVDWAGAPQLYQQRGVLLTSIWDLAPEPLRAWVSSAKNFEPDFRYTYSVSHPRGTGVVTTGTRDWDDYSVCTTLVFNPHRRGGVVVRARGHRRYYAAVFDSWSTVRLVRRDHDDETVLASAPLGYAEDVARAVELTCAGSRLTLRVDGEPVLDVHDDEPRRLSSGGAGFLVTTGTMLADGFEVRAVPPGP